MSIETESFDLTFGSVHYAGTRLTIPIDDDEYECEECSSVIDSDDYECYGGLCEECYESGSM